MVEAFKTQGHLDDRQITSVLLRTNEIAERCTGVELPSLDPCLPAPKLPAGWEKSEFEYLEHRTWQGFRKRFGSGDQLRRLAKKLGCSAQQLLDQYGARIREELNEFKRRKVERYILMVMELYEWMREQNVPLGCARGSVGGSLVAYLLGITELDPLEHNLLFSRFMAPGRLSLPDIDIDVSDEHRPMVLKHLSDRYGADAVALISRIGTLRGRGALRSVARILLIPEEEVEPVAELIDEPIGEDRPESTYAEAVRLATDPKTEQYRSPEWECVRRFHRVYPYVLELVRHIEGSTRLVGVHPAGVVVADRPIASFAPVELREYKPKDAKSVQNVVATAHDKHWVSRFGLVKLDILGVKNVTMIYRLLAWLHRNGRHWLDRQPPADIRDFALELQNIPLDDRATLNAFSQGLFSGIFQYDTPAMRWLCDGMTFRNFDDVVAMLALVRPGTSRSDLGQRYLKNRKTGTIPRVHPVYDRICSSTYGVPIYQEQFMQIFEQLAGYSPVETDAIRRVCAEKHGAEAVLRERDKFVRGCRERGMADEQAESLLQSLANFGAYSFNRCLHEATKVLMYQGRSNLICNLKPGDLVVGPDMRPRRVLSVWRTERPAVSVTFDSGVSVICSMDHRFASDLCDDERIECIYGRNGRVRFAYDNKTRYSRIIGIDDVGVLKMVDIEVDRDNLFVLWNGAISHNSHSVGYATLGFRQMFLKLRFPTEFFASVLASKPEVLERTEFANELRYFGVTVGNVNLGLSGANWEPGPNRQVMAPLTSIKGLGDAAAEAIVAARPFDSLEEFCKKVDRRRCNMRTMKLLAQAGALGDVAPEVLERMWQANKKPHVRQNGSGQSFLPFVELEPEEEGITDEAKNSQA
jgi:DNA polymerase III alpha subunit